MPELKNFITRQLQKRQQDNSLRSLKTTSNLVDFTSNDYLGLARSLELSENIVNKVNSLKLRNNGAAGSRLLSGNSAYTEEVEHKLSEIFNSEAALIFNSGYAANLGTLSSLPQRGDTIIYDELAHASIKDGARLSLAERFSFKHNDLTDLEQKLKRSKGKIFIAVESIYSMDGDACPLAELTALADKYEANIILDEAHSTGVNGKKGAGLAVSVGLEKKIAIRTYTFGKALGCHGACVVGSTDLIQYLINFSRPFVYTTALPPHNIITIDCAFEFLSRNIYLQQQLQEKIDLFCDQTNQITRNAKSKSAIQAFVIPGNENVKRISLQLQNQGFDVRPILSPTVPQGLERLRICLHTYNSNDDIISLSKLLTTQYATISIK